MIINVPLRVEYNTPLREAFVAHLRDGRRGCKDTDEEWYDREIYCAEGGNPNRRELAVYLGFCAGFASANGSTLGDFSKQDD